MKCEKCEKEFVVVEYNDRKVHDKIAFCPFCGHETPKPKPPVKAKPIETLMFILIFIFVIYFLCYYSLMNNA